MWPEHFCYLKEYTVTNVNHLHMYLSGLRDFMMVKKRLKWWMMMNEWMNDDECNQAEKKMSKKVMNRYKYCCWSTSRWA